ncbi:hypothetical protein A2872_02375 [Candidatus Gottesmanbacteria bacterium RIFCSPHIGHO2_01_FULL_42_12]|uniref:Uncharacterized protein n=1 Tax=Candidatus Gottesmanbacteria bacterium RIFCSPHIGHO2_01_FULL_42_12 TaxID=1798377 RepID=A0A1F5Z520_9BACT|nr:MAG: hypothetical protein A2872_02375 [Candidatus Gottesmanbacteria bacterium RIFCSPHIGHO2_01_FULL_42_12]
MYKEQDDIESAFLGKFDNAIREIRDFLEVDPSMVVTAEQLKIEAETLGQSIRDIVLESTTEGIASGYKVRAFCAGDYSHIQGYKEKSKLMWGLAVPVEDINLQDSMQHSLVHAFDNRHGEMRYYPLRHPTNARVQQGFIELAKEALQSFLQTIKQ